MTYYIVKVALSAVLIVAICEIGKRSALLGGLVASFPVISRLAVVWLYVDTRSLAKVARRSASLFWSVLPSLSLFVALPLLLKRAGGFVVGLAGSLAIMRLCYVAMWAVLKRFNAEL